MKIQVNRSTGLSAEQGRMSAMLSFSPSTLFAVCWKNSLQMTLRNTYQIWSERSLGWSRTSLWRFFLTTVTLLLANATVNRFEVGRLHTCHLMEAH